MPQALIRKVDIKPDYFSMVELSDDELNLIHALRFENLESINFRLQNGRIAVLEKTFIEDNRERLVDLLKRGDYQDLEIKVRDGKVVRIERKEINKSPKGKKSKSIQ